MPNEDINSAITDWSGSLRSQFKPPSGQHCLTGDYNWHTNQWYWFYLPLTIFFYFSLPLLLSFSLQSFSHRFLYFTLTLALWKMTALRWDRIGRFAHIALPLSHQSCYKDHLMRWFIQLDGSGRTALLYSRVVKNKCCLIRLKHKFVETGWNGWLTN